MLVGCRLLNSLIYCEEFKYRLFPEIPGLYNEGTLCDKGS